jgi:hypothetical protein
MKKRIGFAAFMVASLVAVLNLPAQAQTFKPIFEDKEGRTAIIAPIGYFGVNTGNRSIKFQYFFSKSAAPAQDDSQLLKRNRFYWGLNVAGSASGELSTLFSNGDFTPGTSANLFLGHRSLFFPTIDKNGTPVLHGDNQISIEDWLTFRLGGQAARYTLYDPARPFNQQIYRESFRGYLAQVAYTVLIGGATSIGASWDVSRENNIDDLASVSFRQQTVSIDPTGQTTRIIEQEFNAYSGAYATEVVNTFSLDAVQYITPASNVNYALHWFGRRVQSDDPVYQTGVGFYLFPKGKVAGGVFIQTSDLTNAVSDTPEFSKRIDLGLTVKFILPGLGVPSP